MTKFVSEKVEVQADASEVFTFLNDFRNFETLLPEQVKNWQATEKTCSFSIEGVATLSMRIAGSSPNTNVHIISEGKNPVDYTLDCFIYPVNEGQCSAVLEFDAALNVFMKAVASRPLQNFVSLLAQKLREHFVKPSE
jgi:carbon monoxide dehydrogenase subunit G